MKQIITIFIFFGIFSVSFAEKNNFFDEAKMLFEKEKYEKSKFLFQRNIVYNPKDAKSYLYLAKIFSLEEDKIEEKKYINTTLLLEPKNEEAMYMLIDIELKRSNFSKVKELKKDFKEICSTLCEKLTSINIRLKEFEKKDES
jgi:tetratricopeptide (TPR) repeat protein|tara:strand:+ start:342 stop:770 length:429 start_codon:yes stop_codon:yes gene_type:complete